MSVALRSLKPYLRSKACPAIRQYHLFLDANKQMFKEFVLNPKRITNDKVVLVDFHTDWCRPCSKLSPILANLEADRSIQTGSGLSFMVFPVNIEQHPELSQKYKIRSIPTVIAFKAGKQVNQFIGALDEAGVRKFLETV